MSVSSRPGLRDPSRTSVQLAHHLCRPARRCSRPLSIDQSLPVVRSLGDLRPRRPPPTERPAPTRGSPRDTATGASSFQGRRVAASAAFELHHRLDRPDLLLRRSAAALKRPRLRGSPFSATPKRKGRISESTVRAIVATRPLRCASREPGGRRRPDGACPKPWSGHDVEPAAASSARTHGVHHHIDLQPTA